MYSNIRWYRFQSQYFYAEKVKIIKPKYTRIRFFYHVTSYLVSLGWANIFFNLNYKTSLEKFQSLNEKELLDIERFEDERKHSYLRRMYYF